MPNSIRNFRHRVATALIALLLASGAGAAWAQAEPDVRIEGRTITVTAEGRAAAVPDMAHVSIGVVQEAEAAVDALAAMNTAAADVIALLQEAGIAPTDMQTGQLSLEPRYVYRENESEGPRITGFIATTTLDVRVRDLPLLGVVLDAAVQDGANRLGGVRFDLQDREPAMDEARRRAVAAARARAALFADAADVELGEVLSISEVIGRNGPRPMMEASFAMDRSAVPVAEGEVNLTAQVTMVYRIAE